MYNQDKGLGCGFYVLLLRPDEVVASGDLRGSFSQHAERSCMKEIAQAEGSISERVFIECLVCQALCSSWAGAIWLIIFCLHGSYILINRDTLLGEKNRKLGSDKWFFKNKAK